MVEAGQGAEAAGDHKNNSRSEMTADDPGSTNTRLERTTPLLAGYSSARDWLDRADRAIERYKRDPLSVDGIDAMFDAILTLNHLRDWVYELHKDAVRERWGRFRSPEDWGRRLAEENEAIGLLSDIANAAKHRARRKTDNLKVEEQRVGSIIHSIFPGYEERILPRLRTFGQVEPVPLDNPADEGRVVRFSHRAHIVYSAQHKGGWDYFIDVANRVRTFWAELLDGLEPASAAMRGRP